MQAEAARKLAGGDKKSKKRKSKGGAEGKKKSKKNDGKAAAAALKSAQDKHAASKEAEASAGRPIFIQPEILADGCKLKDYQLEGVRWLLSLYENGVSGILGDEMGLGKTIQVIATVAALLTKSVSGPFLVVAPLSTIQHWLRELGAWTALRAVAYHDAGRDARDARGRGSHLPSRARAPRTRARRRPTVGGDAGDFFRRPGREDARRERARARVDGVTSRLASIESARDGDDVRPRDASRRVFGSRARSDDRIGRCPLTRARARETRGKA